MASFDTLPPELLQHISEYVDRRDLLRWRRVCTKTCSASFPAFGKAHFRQRRHVFSTHSLQALVDITAHPVLGRFVTKFKLGTTRLTGGDDYTHPRKWTVEQREQHARLREISVQQYDSKAAMIYRAVDDQETLVSGAALKLLTQVFGNVKRRGTDVALGIYDDLLRSYDRSSQSSHWRLRGWGSRTAYGPIFGEAYFMDYAVETLHLLLSAALQAGFPVQTLTLSDFGTQHGTLHQTRPLGVDELDISDGCGGDLEYLKISSENEHSLLGDESGIASVVYLLRIASGLQRLHLGFLNGCGIYLPAPDFTRMLGRIKTTRLRELRIDGARADARIFVGFLGKQKATLRKLILAHCGLVVGCKWSTFLEWIRTNLTLDWFSFTCLMTCESPGHMYGKDVQLLLPDATRLRGRQNVADGLERLVKYCKFVENCRTVR